MIENVRESKDSRKLNNLQGINMSSSEVQNNNVFKAWFPNSVNTNDLTDDKDGMFLGKEDWKMLQNGTFF